MGPSRAERGIASQNPPIPSFTKGDSAPPFLKGDTGGFVVAPALPCTARNDKSTPLVAEELQSSIDALNLSVKCIMFPV